jgi:hypothetical protein
MGIAELFKYASLSPTASMVIQMIKKLPGLAIQSGNPHANQSGNSNANQLGPAAYPHANQSGNHHANQSAYPYTNQSGNSNANQLGPAAYPHGIQSGNLHMNQRGAPYIIYLDNYFTSIALFKELRDIQCGACGTTRP